METQKSLEYYNGLKYEVILKKNGTVYSLFIPEISCITEDEKLEAAYIKLEKAKEEYFQKMLDSSMADHIKEPSVIRGDGYKEIKLFVIKFLIVLLTLSMGGALSMSFVLTKVTNMIGNPSVALRSMTPQEKKGRILKLRETIGNLKPFTDEFKVLFDKPGPVVDDSKKE